MILKKAGWERFKQRSVGYEKITPIIYPLLLSLQYKAMTDASADGFTSNNGSTEKYFFSREGEIQRRQCQM